MPATSTLCRSCRAPDPVPVLSLGATPLADALLEERHLDQPEGRYPLELAFCTRCALVQILEDVPPERLFVENYLYFSSVSDALVRHARTHADELIAGRGLGPDSLVVEVASNDGYLLKGFAERGVPVLGIDPAPDQADAAEEAGIPTLREFFDRALAEHLRAEGRRADVVIANNVMAHTPDPSGFAEGLAVLLADDGVATIENPYVRDLIEQTQFDTIYHEHFSYFSCTSVDHLMRRAGLFLNRVEHFPRLHGGTLRWWVEPRERREGSASAYLSAEAEDGLTEPAFYQAFAAQVEAIRAELLGVLRGLREEGRTIAAYGAAAKGATLLNYGGIGRDLVDFVVDRNPHKQGRYMPGVHIPIRHPSALLEERPDVVLLLTWNFRDEVLAQQEEYRRGGGRFLVPVPWPEIV